MILSRFIRHRSSPRFATSTPVLSSHTIVSHPYIPPPPPATAPHAPDVPQVLIRLHLRPRAPPARKHALQHPRRVLGLPRERGAARRLVHHTQPLPDPPGSVPPLISSIVASARRYVAHASRKCARAPAASPSNCSRSRPSSHRHSAAPIVASRFRRSTLRADENPPPVSSRARSRGADARSRGENVFSKRSASASRAGGRPSGAPRAPASPPPRRCSHAASPGENSAARAQTRLRVTKKIQSQLREGSSVPVIPHGAQLHRAVRRARANCTR